MIEAIIAGGCIAPGRGDRGAQQRRPAPRRRVARGDALRIDIDDALAAITLDAGSDAADDARGDEPAATTVTAAALARRIVATADRALAMQARLGGAAVRRLIGGDVMNPA